MSVVLELEKGWFVFDVYSFSTASNDSNIMNGRLGKTCPLQFRKYQTSLRCSVKSTALKQFAAKTENV